MKILTRKQKYMSNYKWVLVFLLLLTISCKNKETENVEIKNNDNQYLLNSVNDTSQIITHYDSLVKIETILNEYIGVELMDTSDLFYYEYSSDTFIPIKFVGQILDNVIGVIPFDEHFLEVINNETFMYLNEILTKEELDIYFSDYPRDRRKSRIVMVIDFEMQFNINDLMKTLMEHYEKQILLKKELFNFEIIFISSNRGNINKPISFEDKVE